MWRVRGVFRGHSSLQVRCCAQPCLKKCRCCRTPANRVSPRLPLAGRRCRGDEVNISTVAPDTCGSCGRGKAVAHTACHTGLRAPRRPVARGVQRGGLVGAPCRTSGSPHLRSLLALTLMMVLQLEGLVFWMTSTRPHIRQKATHFLGALLTGLLMTDRLPGKQPQQNLPRSLRPVT